MVRQKVKIRQEHLAEDKKLKRYVFLYIYIYKKEP